MRTWPLLTLVLALLLPAANGHARDTEADSGSQCRPQCESPDCQATAGRCLLEADEAHRAKELLKNATNRFSDRVDLHLLLARAYWALGNRVWARRVLLGLHAKKPGDCLIRSWLIWLHLKQAELEQAEAFLEEPGCPGPEPMEGRWQLLRATLARHRKNSEAAAKQVEKALDMKVLFEEDLTLLDQLTAYALPRRPAPIVLRVEVGVGYSSNGLMSNPAAVASLGQDVDTGSSALSIDAHAMFNPPWGRRVRPLLEVGIRSLLLLATTPVSPHSEVTPRDYSYLGLSIRPGLGIGPVKLFYAGQLFLIGGGDKYEEGPRWFYELHRGELQWEPLPWLTFWGGAGRAFFREEVRTRTEADIGVGMMGPVWRLRLLGGLSLRKHWAGEHHVQGSDQEINAYDLWGASFIGSATLPTACLSIRARLVLSFDHHHDSALYFKDKHGDPALEDRQDLLVKGAGEIWSRGWHGLRLGLSYEISHRMSTVDAYGYTDHRGLLRLRWTLELDPWRPGRAKAGAGHVALPPEAAGASELEDERIQDLLRQEDAARRGSSCLN